VEKLIAGHPKKSFTALILKAPGVYGALGYFVIGIDRETLHGLGPICPTRSISRHRIPADALTRFDVRFGAGYPSSLT
jgi:hypothetical protein